MERTLGTLSILRKWRSLQESGEIISWRRVRSRSVVSAAAAGSGRAEAGGRRLAQGAGRRRLSFKKHRKRERVGAGATRSRDSRDSRESRVSQSAAERRRGNVTQRVAPRARVTLHSGVLPPRRAETRSRYARRDTRPSIVTMISTL